MMICPCLKDIFTLDKGKRKTKGNTDLTTLLRMKILLHTEPLFEAVGLNAIVEEMMDENIQASITFYNDDCSMSAAGASVAQPLTINRA